MKLAHLTLAGLVLLTLGSFRARAEDENPPPDAGGEAKPEEEGAKPEDENPPEDAPPPVEPAPDQPNAGIPQSDPEFTKEASKTEFDKGKALYLQGKFKEAEAIFKKVKPDAKGKDDKTLVEVWYMGSQGSALLEGLKQQAKARQVLAALDKAEVYALKYSSTPAEAGFRELVKELETQVYYVIENFDSPSAAFGEKYGKTYVKDPAQSLDGSLCLRWASTKTRDNVTLKVRNLPVQDLSKIEAVQFWVNVAAAPSDAEVVFGCADSAAAAKKKAKPAPAGKKKKGAEPVETTGAYKAPLQLSGGRRWQKIRIPMASFVPEGEASLTSAIYFQIQVGSGRNFDLMIDKIALVKKPGTEGADKKKSAK